MPRLPASIPAPRCSSLPSRTLALTCACHCIVALAPWVAAAQQTTDPVRSAAVTAVTSEIVIDGSLDEAAWRQAPTIGDLVQRIPVAGAAPTERTEVRLLYDEENLYIGVMCHDSEPDRVLASQMARDASLNADDRLAIVLDTFPRPEQRLPFRDQSGRRHGRRSGVRERRDERRLGRHLDRADGANRRGMERGVRHPLQDPELPGRGNRLGLQHQPDDTAEAGGEPLDGGALPDRVLPDLRGGPDHEPGRPAAGYRARCPPLSGPAMATSRHRRRYRRRQAGRGPVLQHHSEPQAVLHREHRLR